MPMKLADFLELDATLKSLRQEIDESDREWRRRLKGDEAALVQLLTNRWEAGIAGWMTADEAQTVAAELNAAAAEQGIAARAEVRDDYLVFTGGRHGHQLLHLPGTSPIRARKHWPGYLEACPSSSMLRRLGARFGTQLDLLGRVVGWNRGKRGDR